MREYRFLVYTNARDGRDAEFNRWYDEIHLPEVIAVPGFTGAERLTVRPLRGEPEPPHRYLAIYDIESDDVEKTIAGLMERGTTGGFRMSDALDADGARTVLYEVATPHRGR